VKLMLVNLAILETILASNTLDLEQFKKAFYGAVHLLEVRVGFLTLRALFTICPLIIINAFFA
jgi:hypothetical protein